MGDDGKAEEGPQWRSGLEGKQAESPLQGHWNQLEPTNSTGQVSCSKNRRIV